MKDKEPKRSKDKGSDKEFRLMVQPGAGVHPLLKAIDSATKSIEILIFRFDRAEVAEALIRAVERGVAVQALIAWTNRGGEQHLRRLETRFLAAGVTVSRTASDLARYHAKMMIVDKKRLFVLAFNFTALDIDRSRSFGLEITTPKMVKEASALYEADTNRKPYQAGLSNFIVSPVNARQELAKYLEAAKSELLIYDPGLSDPQMVRILEERARAGVDIKILGDLKRPSKTLKAMSLGKMRLHARTVVRDGKSVFVGSQSLRAAELDARREVGVMLTDKDIVHGIHKVFEGDWKEAKEVRKEPGVDVSQTEKLARRVAKAMTRELPPVGEVIDALTGSRKKSMPGVDMDSLEDSVRSAVKAVVLETIQEAGEVPAA